MIKGISHCTHVSVMLLFRQFHICVLEQARETMSWYRNRNHCEKEETTFVSSFLKFLECLDFVLFYHLIHSIESFTGDQVTPQNSSVKDSTDIERNGLSSTILVTICGIQLESLLISYILQ